MSETVITAYIDETPEQEKARTKAGKPVPTFQFVSVKTKPTGKGHV